MNNTKHFQFQKGQIHIQDQGYDIADHETDGKISNSILNENNILKNGDTYYLPPPPPPAVPRAGKQNKNIFRRWGI